MESLRSERGQWQWEPLIAFRPENTTLKCVSLEDCPDCKKEQTGREKWVLHSNSVTQSALSGGGVEALGSGHPESCRLVLYQVSVQAGVGEKALKFTSRHFGRYLPFPGPIDFMVLSSPPRPLV